MKTVNLQVRINEDLKQEVSSILKAQGLSYTSMLDALFRQIIKEIIGSTEHNDKAKCKENTFAKLSPICFFDIISNFLGKAFKGHFRFVRNLLELCLAFRAVLCLVRKLNIANRAFFHLSNLSTTIFISSALTT